MQYYKATRIEYGGINFDSKFEFEVYKTLISHFKPALVKVHEPLVIRPRTQWFPAQVWKVDYVVNGVDSLEGGKLFVECKGIIQADFKERIKNLAYFCPLVFQNLVIVTPSSQSVVRGLIAYGGKDFYNILSSKDYVSLVDSCKKLRGND